MRPPGAMLWAWQATLSGASWVVWRCGRVQLALGALRCLNRSGPCQLRHLAEHKRGHEQPSEDRCPLRRHKRRKHHRHALPYFEADRRSRRPRRPHRRELGVIEVHRCRDAPTGSLSLAPLTSPVWQESSSQHGYGNDFPTNNSTSPRSQLKTKAMHKTHKDTQEKQAEVRTERTQARQTRLQRWKDEARQDKTRQSKPNQGKASQASRQGLFGPPTTPAPI